MSGIRGRTVDGAEMYPCPLCGGQVYAKLLFIGVAGDMRGVISAMCADCGASATRTLPPDVAPSPTVDEAHYRAVLDALTSPPTGEGEA